MAKNRIVTQIVWSEGMTLREIEETVSRIGLAAAFGTKNAVEYFNTEKYDPEIKDMAIMFSLKG